MGPVDLTTDRLDVQDLGEGVWRLRLDRPEARNALSTALRDDLSHALDVLALHPGAGAVVLTGSGTTFCAGFDLGEFGPAEGDPALHARLWASSDRLHHTVLRSPLPVVAALNGPALAGGFDLATLCDLRVGHPGVWFSRPEVDFAVPLYGPLRDLVGGALARELSLTGRRVDADEARRVGLLNEVVPEAEVEPVAVRLARAIAARPAELVRRTRAKIAAAAGLAASRTLEL